MASNSQDTGKRLTNLSAFRCPLTSLSNILPTVNEVILRNHRGSSQFFLLKVWRNICPIEDESLPVLKDIRALLSVFNTTTKRSLCLGALSSVQFSCSVVSDSLRPHESQHARPPCPSPTPGFHPENSGDL